MPDYYAAYDGNDSNDGLTRLTAKASGASVTGLMTTGVGATVHLDFDATHPLREYIQLTKSGASASDRHIFQGYNNSRAFIVGSNDFSETVADTKWTLSTGGGTNEYFLTKDDGTVRTTATAWCLCTCSAADWAASGIEAVINVNRPRKTPGSLAKGEWGWGDVDGKSFNMVYYRPLDGEDMATLHFEISQRSYPLSVNTRNYLHFKKLTLFNAGTFCVNHQASVAGSYVKYDDVEGYRADNSTIDCYSYGLTTRHTNIAFSGCKFLHAQLDFNARVGFADTVSIADSEFGYTYDRDADNNAQVLYLNNITNLVTTGTITAHHATGGTNGHGVYVYNCPDAILNIFTTYSCSAQGTYIATGSNNLEIARVNTYSNTLAGLAVTASTGVLVLYLNAHNNGTRGGYIVSGANDCIVADGEVYENGSYGVQVNGSTGCCLITKSHANTNWGIYFSAAANNGIIQNCEVYGHVTVTNIRVNACTGMTVRYNKSYLSGGGSGIYFEASSHNALIYKNRCYDNGGLGIYVKASTGVRVYNNTVDNCAGSAGIYMDVASTTHKIKNNIVSNCATSGYSVSLDSVTGQDNSNNAYYNCGANVRLNSTNDKTTDPLFLDQPNNDYHLTSSSPLINAGVNLTSEGITQDADGQSTPQGASFDIGAFELGACSVSVHPVGQDKAEGDTATFTITAAGQGTVTYQWQKDTGAGWGNIASATTNSYTTDILSFGDNGTLFRCVVNNGVNTANSNSATLTIGGHTYSDKPVIRIGIGL